MKTRQTEEERKATAAAWYKANAEKKSAMGKAWRKTNSQRCRELDVSWRKAHPEKSKAIADAYRKAHPEKTKAARIAWQKANPEKQKAATIARRKANKERHGATEIAWRKANPGRVKELNAEWHRNNPEKIKIKRHTRRALVIGNGGKLSPGLESKLLAFQKNRCAICRASLKKTGHHFDHIVPLAKGGKNIDSNIQLTCPKCNLEKGHKDPIAFMQGRGFLL